MIGIWPFWFYEERVGPLPNAAPGLLPDAALSTEIRAEALNHKSEHFTTALEDRSSFTKIFCLCRNFFVKN